ncbi:unnamed protein product [Boreogadus saida]
MLAVHRAQFAARPLRSVQTPKRYRIYSDDDKFGNMTYNSSEEVVGARSLRKARTSTRVRRPQEHASVSVLHRREVVHRPPVTGAARSRVSPGPSLNLPVLWLSSGPTSERNIEALQSPFQPVGLCLLWTRGYLKRFYRLLRSADYCGSDRRKPRRRGGAEMELLVLSLSLWILQSNTVDADSIIHIEKETHIGEI